MQNLKPLSLNRYDVETLLRQAGSPTKLNLSNQNLDNIDLAYLNLNGIILAHSSLLHADLHETVLSRSNLNGAYIVEVNLAKTLLNRANLVEAHLMASSFLDANLCASDLRSADLSYADLRGADLSKAYLNRANLYNTKFENTNIEGAYVDLEQRDFLATQAVIGLSQAIIGEPIHLLDNSLFAQIVELYTIADEPKVITFLTNNSFLANFLKEAHTKLFEYFPQSNLYLEVLTNPQLNNRPELAVIISPTCSPHETIDRMDQFYDDWWFDKVGQTQRKLSISVDYKDI